MAFLCPVRIRRGSAKGPSLPKNSPAPTDPGAGSMGRITGSASIETLVRVGIEKEHGLGPDSKMLVLHDFTPCVDDELEVRRGQTVNVLYRENDWVYVIAPDTRQEGFVPHSYCAPYDPRLANELACKKKLPRGESEALQERHSPEPDVIQPFPKDPSGGRYIVLYTFIARDENDVSVERGEFVTVLNKEDPDWHWIVRSDGQEGFIPSAFAYPADNVIGGQPPTTEGPQSAPEQQPGGEGAPEAGGRQHGAELVMLYDYKAQAPDDLTVRRGDWIYADMGNQTVDGWLWAYAPKTRRYGFIPKAYARPPAMTSL